MDPKLMIMPALVLGGAAAVARLWMLATCHLRTRRWIRYLRATLPSWAADDHLSARPSREPRG